MADDSIYKEVLLDHFHNPRNKGDLDSMDAVKRGSNPRCGDDVEVGINYEHEIVNSVRFRGRGCSICLASASIMSEATKGLSFQQALQLIDLMRQWFDRADAETPSSSILAALGAIRKHPARKKCVLLAWVALEQALVDAKE
jgi:nitrogen fixation NifU-like protein